MHMPRTIETNFTQEDVKIEGSLRPQYLKDYIGQEKVKSNLKVYIEAAKKGATRLTMRCFTVRPVWEKPHWQVLLPTRWGST